MTLVTEKEAAEKWCPYGAGAKMVGEFSADGHPLTVYIRPETARCIGSKCMAWRWNEPPGPRAPDDMREPDIRGYCGAF